MPARLGFARALALVAGAGLALRVAYVLVAAREIPVVGDALTFHLVADRIAAGDGFFRPPNALIPAPLGTGPTAEHPPLFELLLAAFDVVGLDGFTGQKLALCAVGTATVVLVGVAGRLAAGPRAGLIAAAIAAVYPFLWVADGALMSETLYGALIAATMVIALLFVRGPSVRLAAALGAVVALAALTRGEGVLLVPLLVLPLTLRAAAAGRWRLTAVALVATAVVLAPWFVRNLATFEEPVPISTNGMAVFVGANCDGSYHGRFAGLWRYSCYAELPPGDESQKAAAYRERGFDYAADHSGRALVVVALRVGRVWELVHPVQHQLYGFFEGRSRWAGRLGLVFFYPLALLAIAGALLLRRRRAPLWPLAAFPLLVTVTAALVYGYTRFRFAAEPALVVLAAVAIDALLERRGRSRPGRATDPAVPARA